MNSGGEMTEVPIVENGGNIRVTNDLVRKYIRDVANFKLNKQMEVQSTAFLRGFNKVIDKDWLRMFGQVCVRSDSRTSIPESDLLGPVYFTRDYRLMVHSLSERAANADQWL